MKDYPSGFPQIIVQVRPDMTGRYIPEGILTEWYEGGEPKRLLDYSNGKPHGVEITWDRSGQVLSRGEYRKGVRIF